MAGHWTDKLAPEDPEKLAKRAIWLIEKRIHEDFGAHVRMGAELEFTTDGAIPSGHFLNRAGGTPVNRPENFYAPARSKPERAPLDAPGYETSHSISVVHRIPLDVDATLRQFELIFSHLTPHGNIEQGNLVNLARSIAHEKRCLTTDPQLKDVSFAATSASGDIQSSGLHLNISLHDSEGFPLLGQRRDSEHPGGFIPSTRTQALLSSLYSIQREGQYLLGTAPAHFERLAPMVDTSDLMNFTTSKTDPGLNRIENRIPAADSSPNMAIMLTLAGIYDGLARHATERTSTPTPHLPLPTAAAEARALFQHSSTLIPLLNRLEPELGDRLRDAALAPTPSKPTPQR